MKTKEIGCPKSHIACTIKVEKDEGPSRTKKHIANIIRLKNSFTPFPFNMYIFTPNSDY